MIKKTRSSGFTLLEVMIALVIFSIGLLGLAGIQSAGIRNNQLSYTRTVATQLAYDMADRMRNNRGTDYAAAVAGGGTNCITSSCNAATIASFDLFEWDSVITNAASPLKNGRGNITVNGVTFTVIVAWNDSGTAAVPALPGNCVPGPPPPGIACVSIDVIP